MTLADRIRDLIEQRGAKVAALERDAGLEPDTIRNILRGNIREPGATKIYAIARVLGVTVEFLLGEPQLGEGESPPGSLPVLFKTGGGAWVQVEDYAQDGLGEREGAPVYAYRRFRQWYEILDGDSMNRLYPDGTYLQVVDTVDMGYEPKSGDIVVVERCRDGGFLRERSVKQVEVYRNRIELWPRSTNPRWKEPIVINDHPDDETVEVRIVGLVLKGIIEARDAA